jgi:hypothetical protein
LFFVKESALLSDLVIEVQEKLLSDNIQKEGEFKEKSIPINVSSNDKNLGLSKRGFCKKP